MTVEHRDGGVWLGGYDIKPLLDKAAADARAAERERAAEIVLKMLVQDYGLSPIFVRKALADAIRASS